MGFKTYTCPIAKSCGGCEWLAVPYPIQLKRKRDAVLQLFADVLPSGATVQQREELVPIYGMDTDGMEPTGYRHKAATPFAPGKRGSIRSGFYTRGNAQDRAVRELRRGGTARARGAPRRCPRRRGAPHPRL